MINFKEIEQCSLEWHQIKWGKIGGTLSKGLFVNSDTLFLDILSQQLEEFEPSESFTSDAMQHGKDNEPFARAYLNEYTGLEFKETGWLECDENTLLGISPDGITEDEKTACEIKCFGRKKHIEVLFKNDIPLENIFQCIHYFTVNPKLEKLYFIAFRAESAKHFIKELTLDTEINIGTKSRPRIMSIEAARDYSLEKAEELENKLKKFKNQLEF